MTTTPDQAAAAQLPRLWAGGRCPRDHDITQPANIRTIHAADRDRHLCVPCEQARAIARYHGGALAAATAYPDRTCDRCEKRFSRPHYAISQRTWAVRRFCGDTCRLAALVELARDRRTAGGPLNPDELARLRRLVGVT
jgi:hypothetical protein